jgi:hypothetical protein
VRAAPFDPYDALARLPGVTVVTSRLPAGEMGCYDHTTATVHLGLGLTAAEERSTAAHEAVHAERGDCCLEGVGPDGTRLDARQELQVHRIAANRLVTLDALADALAGTHALEEAAEELAVDEDTLWLRLESLTSAEKTYLQQRIEMIEEKSWPTT